MIHIFLISIVLKGIGAILELVLQIIITRSLGISGYGMYATWISSADLIFWVFFSGIIKCNTFYLTKNSSVLTDFKRRYYLRYVVPGLSVAAMISVFGTGKFTFCFVLLISGMELVVLDQSSELIVQGQHYSSLFGEYILGRGILLTGILALSSIGKMEFNALLIIYILQYVGILFFFLFKKRKRNNKEIDVSENVTLKKWVAFQRADIVFTMIGQMPVLLQYFFSGGFEAGVVSIVLLIKKLINFITGPTAKIFLPEFSKLYHAGKKEEIRKIFAAIMQLQMLFVGPLAVMLIGFPNVILNIWAEELLQYTKIFSVCSMIFLIATTLGPCGGVMQMTGNENKDNRYREVALVAMAVVMIVFSKNHLFVLYGLCAQTAIEATGKYIFVCKWMEKAPIKIGKYISWWIAPTLAIVMGRMLRLHSSYVLMLILAGVVFVITFVIELCDDKGILYTMVERRGRNVSQNRVD